MGGKDDLSNAVLGGSSDYLNDIQSKFFKVFFTPAEEKVWIGVIIHSLKFYFATNQLQ